MKSLHRLQSMKHVLFSFLVMCLMSTSLSFSSSSQFYIPSKYPALNQIRKIQTVSSIKCQQQDSEGEYGYRRGAGFYYYG